MADCDKLFRHYNSIIKLSDENRELLIRVRDGLREKMDLQFSLINYKVSHDYLFQSQGSFVMDTIITPYDDDFDLDDGIYFIGNLAKENRPPIQDFHDLVLKVIGRDENYGKVTDKDTCVRVSYVREKFHIDLPIYYSDNFENPDLAHKTKGWILSNPIEFIAWFEDKVQSKFDKAFILESRLFSEYEKWTADIRKDDAQLRRIVRYLKAWGDILRGEMPPGIIMTILAAENYRYNERDDIALRDTLQNIKQFLKQNNGKCPRPTAPIGEDLFKDYSAEKKSYFLVKLDEFVNSANMAISNPDQKAACLKWQKHLGYRFPCSMAKSIEEHANKYTKPAIIGDTARSAK